MIDDLLNRAAWRVHNAAEASARKVGACWQCSKEYGCRATDMAGMAVDPDRKPFEMHLECAKKIAKIQLHEVDPCNATA